MSMKEYWAQVMAIGLVVAGRMAVAYGRVVVVGQSRAEEALRIGGVLVLSNHPSLVETVVLPSLFWHWRTGRYAPKVPWSVADDQLFGDRPWIFPAFRCIPISRRDPSAYPTARIMYQRLRDGGNVIVYPEGGRTIKGETFIEKGDRRVRPCRENPLRVAALARALILPVWIDHPAADRPRPLFEDYRLLWSGPSMRITFGTPTRIGKNFDERDVAELLLDCGRG